jgi:hypothetical protein
MLSHLLVAYVALMAFAAALHALPMTRTPTGTITFTYTKGGSLPADQTITIKAPTSTQIFFTVDPATLPDWLTLDKTSGSPTLATGTAVKFGVSAIVASKPIGTHNATVGITSTSPDVDSPLLIPVTLVVKAAVSTLSASAVEYSAVTWKTGDALPTATLTLTSDGEPINFSVVAASLSPISPAWVTVSPTSGVAYSWGTPLTVTFAPSAFESAAVGANVTGRLTVTKVGGSALPIIPLSIAIDPPVPTLTEITPTQVPQTITASTTRTIAVKGTNFARGMPVEFDPDDTGGAVQAAVTESCATGTGNAWCFQSSQLFFLRLSAATLALGTPGTPALLSVVGVTTAVPIESKPILYAVTDAASFVSPADELDVSPFEIISIFGENFGTPLVGPAMGADGRFPNVLDTDQFLVHFNDASDSSDLTADPDGYLLLWTATQINVLVPSTLPVAGNQALEMIVTASGTAGDVWLLDIAAGGATPGLFTYGGGLGPAVAINSDGTINSVTNPARFGQSQAIQLFLSGLGDVDGGADIAVANGTPAAAPADCSSKVSYLTRLNVTANPDFDSPDGAVVDITANVFPPCLDPADVSLTLGGANASTHVTYAGWSSGSVAGLYQVNVFLPVASTLAGLSPAATTAAQQYPIVVTVGGVSSQTGAYVFIKN